MPLSSASQTDLVVLSASQTVTTGSAVTSIPVPIYGVRTGVELVLDVTAAATAVGDKLDVTVQTLLGGSLAASGKWLDVMHFTQVAGNGGALTIVGKIISTTSVAMYTYAALSAGNQKDTLGDYWRISYTVTNSSSPSFTFSVTALPF